MTTLKKGARGAEVEQLQTLLKCGLEIDGVFGAKTDAAVRAFQIANNLKGDGIVGVLTWAALGVHTEHSNNPRPADFKQYDSRWGKQMYSNHNAKAQTMASSGCGPTSAADIVATWWDTSVTPMTLALKAVAWGYRTYSNGTAANFFKKIHDLYAPNAEYKHATTSMTALIDCLDQGGYAVVNFGPGANKKWTSGGHYCVIYKYDGAHFYINDPASDKAARAKGTYDEVKAARKAFYLFWRE